MKVIQTPGVHFFDGIPVSIPNEVSKNSSDFYISFNGSSRDYGCPTTALVVGKQMDNFYILCGDHRKQYAEAVTLDGCMAYYRANPNLQHEMSDKLEESK